MNTAAPTLIGNSSLVDTTAKPAFSPPSIRIAIVTAALVSTLGMGCATQTAARETNRLTETTPTTETAPATTAPTTTQEADRLAFVPEPVRFPYDQSSLDDAGRQQLTALGNYLKSSPGVKVRVIGHADERGTADYNLSLGEDRARVARDYLTRMGIGSDRIITSSRGEEEPAVAGPGESAYAANRRDEFVLLNEVAQR